MTNATVLNIDFLYLGETTLARAFSLVRDGRAEILSDRGEMRTVSVAFRIPRIIRMLTMVDFRRRKVPLTKRNVIERDESVCQYCGTTEGRMTVDHVQPRSKGGPDTWENLVCCCRPCNSRKDSHDLRRAGMELRRQPKEPSLVQMLRISTRGRNVMEMIWNGTFSIGDEAVLIS
jgi:5-methylcytosine-specific restriction endonuclease McrA